MYTFVMLNVQEMLISSHFFLELTGCKCIIQFVQVEITLWLEHLCNSLIGWIGKHFIVSNTSKVQNVCNSDWNAIDVSAPQIFV